MDPYFYRSLFPILKTHTHLASCSQGAMSKNVSAAIEQYHYSLLELGKNWDEAMHTLELTSKKFAKLIGCDRDEVAILCSVSDAISAIATSLPYNTKKNKIVFTDMDFPTVGHIWSAQTPFKNKLTMIQSSNGQIPIEKFTEAVTSDTLITCIPHVNYYNGLQQNISNIAEIVHSKGSLLFVDAYQSAGHIPIHVKEMDIDILAAGMRKYMLGIPGVAFLYIKKELAEELTPRITGWLGQTSISAFDIYQSNFAAGARRFETGTPSFISVYAAYEALKLLLDVGIDKIEAYLNELTPFIIDYGQEQGLQLAGPVSTDNRTSLISFYVKDAAKVEEVLKSRQILVAARNDVIRIAPHFYNLKDEVKLAINEIANLTI